jgi:prepilin signal peptidase PulO-like enzyme (type II secretory pathway)
MRFAFRLHPIGGTKGHRMILAFVLFSLILGILVNGLADNLPDGRSETKATDLLPLCSYCGRTRKWSDLSALVSIFLRGGECARCRAPRPFRDLFVEIILGVAIPALWLTGSRMIVPMVTDILLVIGTVLLLVMDYEHRTVLIGIVLVMASLLVSLAWLQGTDHLLWVLEGGAAGAGMLLVCYLFGWLLARLFHLGGGIEPLGQGDIWIAGIVGIMNGWPGIVPTVFLGIFLAGVISVLLILVNFLQRKPVRNITFAFGPYLLVSGWLLRLAGSTILILTFGSTG